MRAVCLGGAVGWFHPATGGRGVVVVGAHGYEDLCSRVTLRELAEGLAAAGLPVLRLEPRDTGDAADLPAEADRIAAWTADVGAAIDWMRSEVGAREIVLVGLRIGALLATAAAVERGDVDHLVLLAPPPSGRAHRRELAVLARLVDGMGGGVLADGAIEIAGFRLDAATLERLAAIDPTAPAARPAARVTLVGDVGSAGLGRIAEGCAALGAAVDRRPFEGYARMMCDPTASEPARAMVADLVAHLAAGAPPALPSSPPPVVVARLDGDGWVEERFVFGDGLAGVLCRPAEPIAGGRAAIWLNSGRNPHIGWARQAVDLSRRLAGDGVAVLRIDLAGIGDSPAHAHTPPTALYHDVGKADVRAAIDEAARRGFGRPWVIGACSGAYQAFHSAIDDERIAGIVLVNQLCFVWDASYETQLSAWMTARPGEFASEAGAAERAGGSEARPSPIGRGWRAAKRRLRRGLDLARRLANALRGPRSGFVEGRFGALAKRGVAVSIVLSEGDRAVAEFELHTGPGGRRVAGLPGLEILMIPNADHSLTPAAARARLGDHLAARLGAGARWAGDLRRPSR